MIERWASYIHRNFIYKSSFPWSGIGCLFLLTLIEGQRKGSLRSLWNKGFQDAFHEGVIWLLSGKGTEETK